MYFAKFTSFKKNNLKFVTTRITLVKNLGICCWEKNVTLSWLIFPLVSLKFTNLLSWLNFHLFFWSSFWQILLNYFSLLWIFIGFMAIYHLTCGYVLWCGLIRLLLLSHFSRVRPCAPPQTAAHEAPPALRFSRQEHWSGLPFPSPVRESEKGEWSRSVVSDSRRPHGPQPTRLLRPWDFPGSIRLLLTGLRFLSLLWHSPSFRTGILSSVLPAPAPLQLHLSWMWRQTLEKVF